MNWIANPTILCDWSLGTYVMRKNVAFAVLLAGAALSGWAQAQEAKSETLLRWHFAGTKALAEHKNLTTLREILGLPETAALRQAGAAHLANRFAARFTKEGDTNVNPRIVQEIQPLVGDLVESESVFLMAARGGQDSDWALAVKLEDGRSQLWSKSLSTLASASGMQSETGDARSWTARKEKYRLSFSREKEWTLIEGGYGNADASVGKDFRNALNQRRGQAVLTMEVNTPLLAKIWGAEQLLNAPKVTLKAEPRGNGLRSELVASYPEELGIKPEKWNVPTGLIYEPLIGFTAIQGVAKKLERSETFQSFGAKETPNQLFMWTHSSSPFHFWLAGEVKNPKEVVNNAARELKEIKLPLGSIEQSTNRAIVFWDGPPVVKPFLAAAPAPHSSFLLAGLFPATKPSSNTIPVELVNQLKTPNLVYYEWEITGERLRRWSPVWQLYQVVANKSVSVNTAASFKWADALEPRLGNTVTEGTLENPRQIKFIRQSQIGFSGLELVLLAHWLDGGDLMKAEGLKLQQQQSKPPALPAP